MNSSDDSQTQNDILLRLSKLEQMSVLLAEAEKTKLTTLQQFQQQIAVLEQKLSTYVTTQSLMQVSRIYPKSKTVIFVGRDYFSDNIKYAYLAFHEWARGKDIKYYLFTQDPVQENLLKSVGLPYLTVSDPNFAQILLAAKTAVLQDNFVPLNPGETATHALLQGAKFIQLWHGIPLKEIGLRNLCQAEVMAACGPFDALVATNEKSRADWADRFAFKEFAALGYPRNDIFFREPSKTDLVNVDAETLSSLLAAKKEGGAVVLYAPTFRDHVGAAWFEKAGIAALADHCKARGVYFLINLHPSEQGAIPALRQHYPGLRFVAPKTDIYPVAKYADVMLTDYSSLAYDFLLLDRPLVFYRPDHEEYVTQARHLIAGREHYSPGPVTSTIGELIKMIDAAVASIGKPEGDPFRQARQSLCKELFDYRDGDAGKRVAELIGKYLV
jgi:CDP-glycerol glycerophosphotransferase